MDQENSNVKLGILVGVILLAVVGGFLGWRAFNRGLTPEEAVKLSAPASLPAGSGNPNANVLRPPGAMGATPTLPTQGAPSLIPPAQPR